MPSATAPDAALATQPVTAPGNPGDTGVAAYALASYTERLRNMPPNELSAELARLAPSTAPQAQLQLALALAQVQQLPELIRAQESVAKVLDNSSDEAKALHPLAKLLGLRLSEERRLEDLLDKQNQQVKDLQRRLDQTTERLEALKAIERSLVSRPTPALPSVSAPSGASSRIRNAPASSTQPASPSASPGRSGLPTPGLQP